jgi:hypothetical protein
MLKASVVFTNIRSLIEEEDNEELTDALLVPHVNMAQQALILKVLANPNIERMKTVVIVPNIVAGTKDLSAQFDTGKLLELLTGVISMRERQAGTDDSQFLTMVTDIDLPSVVQSNFNRCYQFTGSTIVMPGATQALDFRVYGTFEPAPVKDGDSPMVPNTSLIISHMAAAKLCRPHNKELATDLRAEADIYAKQFMNLLIMEIQEESIRQQSFRGR